MFYSITNRPSRQSLHASAALDNAALQAFLESTFSVLKQEIPKPASADEEDNIFKLVLDVPGLTREQIAIAIEADVVRISSNADAPRKLNTAYRFPTEIDAQNSSAKLENGVLTLSLGKQVLANKVVKLDIN